VKNEQFSIDYMINQNPLSRVPLLIVDNETLIESVSICNYLNKKYPYPPLFPQDILYQAKIFQIVEIINSGIQPIQNLAVLRKLMDLVPKEEKQKQKVEWGRYWIENGFKALELILKKHSGKFCFGDSITLADIFLIPQIYNANRFGVNMNQFPKIKKINRICYQIKGFRDAHPNQQPDAH
jgi:maleylacetoacetate isomerase